MTPNTRIVTVEEVVEALRKAVADAGSQSALSAKWRGSPTQTYIAGVLSGKQRPGPLMCRRLGFKAVTIYKKGE